MEGRSARAEPGAGRGNGLPRQGPTRTFGIGWRRTPRLSYADALDCGTRQLQ
jgi:hypothetical protein